MKRKIMGILLAITVFTSSVAVSAGSEAEVFSGADSETVTKTENSDGLSQEPSAGLTAEDTEAQGASDDRTEDAADDSDLRNDKSENSEPENEDVPVSEPDSEEPSDMKPEESAPDNEEPSEDKTENNDSEEAETLEQEEILMQEDDTLSQKEDFTLFDEENADLLNGESEEDNELIREIEEGQVLAFTPAMSEMMEQNEEAQMLSTEEDIAVMALKPGEYYVKSGGRAYCDEVWTEANDFVFGNHTRMASTFREVHYIDDTGVERKSPLYCLKATKTGVDNVTLKDEAVKVLKNATIQKLLYFGYGGPGDLGTNYDPSCSHINWSRWQNRYIFTHIALSKVYFNDCAYATASEVEHVGINRFINTIKGMTIPARNKAAVSVLGEEGWMSASGRTIPLSVYRSRNVNYPYVPDSMKDGFQMSTLMKVTDGAKAGNGITVTRGSGEKWQLAYWKNAAEYNAQKTNPTMMAGTQLKLKEGAYFLFIFPLNATAPKKFQCKMMLQPVSYILVDGKTQTGNDEMQDFGAFVYQGTRGLISFTMKPSAYGSIKLTKTEPNTAERIADAEYALYTAGEIRSGYRTMYKKDQKIASGTTDKNGTITFEKLIPGKYYIKETKNPSGYVLNTAVKNVTVSGGKATAVNVKDIMDISGTVSITKKDGDTSDPLAGAEFMLYEWSKSNGTYKLPGKLLEYDGQNRIYDSEKFHYTEDNQGKFRIKETKPPRGYTGKWQKDISLTESGTYKKFSFTVLNYQTNKRKVEIQKTDAATGKILENAEFKLYEYSASQKKYKTSGVLLKYDEDSQHYFSEDLLKTIDNEGRFRIVETKIPVGYTGSWEKEIDITDKNASLFFKVTNTEIPDYTGTIYLKKTDSYTGEDLDDAEFKVYQWNSQKKAYEDDLKEKSTLKYNSSKKEYVSRKLLITEKNQGKFRVVETKNPLNYTGKYEKEIVFQKKKDSFNDEVTLKAENTPDTVPLGRITIRKKIREEEITWAHGNPTFFFVAEGKDLSGVSHRYEDYITFVPDGYDVDGNGYATLSVTLENVPLGQYDIWEKPVLRYYLKTAWANTDNVRITKGVSPAYGTDPKQVVKGTAALTVGKRNASLTFVNEKARYDKYSHNDCVKNTLPLQFSEK